MSAGVPELVVDAEGVEKAFGPVRALKGAALQVRRGTVEGLVGHNGAGKSTLLSIVCGAQTADGGTIRVGSEPFAGGGVAEAERRGVVLVPQRTSLFDGLSVLDNLMIPRRFPLRAGALIGWRAARAAARRALEEVALDADLDASVSSLSVPARRALMIARALLRDPGLLILDEPTEAFTEGEVTHLFAVLRGMVERGRTVLYVSHRLDEVLELADRVTIMRDGQTVGRHEAAALERRQLVGLMLGDTAPAVSQLEAVHSPAPAGAAPLLALRGVSTRKLADVSLTVGPGEIVGLYGLAGSGRTEVLRAVAGLRPTTAGEIRLAGERLDGTVGARRRRGVTLLSEDVGAEGALPGLTVRENVAIGVPGGVRADARVPLVSRRTETERARAALGVVGLDAGRMEAPIETLSGGMQQKVMLARSVVGGSSVWLLDEPMTGLDVHSRLDLARLLRELVCGAAEASGRPRGALVILSDFEDLALMCDRVYGLRDGRVVAELQAGRFDEHDLVHAVSFDLAA